MVWISILLALGLPILVLTLIGMRQDRRNSARSNLQAGRALGLLPLRTWEKVGPYDVVDVTYQRPNTARPRDGRSDGSPTH